MKLIPISAISISCIIIASCGHTNTVESIATPEDQLIEITHEQFESEGMSLGSPAMKPFTETVTCNGNTVAIPSGTAVINSPLAGLVKSIYCKPGQKVNKGETLFELTGNELIDLQMNLNESASELTKARSEYERIKSLYDENVGTEKELILAESAYKAANTRYSGLKMKLQLIGLDVSEVENSKYYNSFNIKSPINGFVTKINLSIGQYVDLQSDMAEILDNTKLQLVMAVFEKDVSKLMIGQKIEFQLLGDKQEPGRATLISIGKNVDEGIKAIKCFAKIDDPQHIGLVNNAFVRAIITVGTDTLNSVPEESILKSEGNSYILALVKDEGNIYFFKKIRVDTGSINNGFVEIMNNIKHDKILSKGAYNINID